MPTRRQMLKVAINSSALVALSRTVPAFLAQSAAGGRPRSRWPRPGRHPA